MKVQDTLIVILKKNRKRRFFDKIMKTFGRYFDLSQNFSMAFVVHIWKCDHVKPNNTMIS